MIEKFITDSPEALKAALDKNVVNVWIHGSETYITTEIAEVTEGLNTVELVKEILPKRKAAKQV